VKQVLIIGAGRSSTYLIDYLLQFAPQQHWTISIADLQLDWAQKRAGGHPNARAIAFNLDDATQLSAEIAQADVVISLAPADKHIQVAQVCLEHKKSLFTASYISPTMQAMAAEVEAAGILFMNELGCDPGIDHMSALALLHEIRQEGGQITAFSSYAGGLIAPASDNQPWHYKFSWNPRNVVLAGEPGPARYLANGVIRYIPYFRLFREKSVLDIPGFGPLEAYANRDSLPYIAQYGLDGIPSILRGTLRYPTYCDAWHVFAWLGMTNENLPFTNCTQLKYRDFLLAFLYPDEAPTVRESFVNTLTNQLGYNSFQIADLLEKFDYLEFFGGRCFIQENGNAASLLQEILEEKWRLGDNDKDLVVMHHIVHYTLNQKPKMRTSTLLLEGADNFHTAMAKTVGLPLAIAVRHYLEGKIHLKGVHIPIQPEIYLPILKELGQYGIQFKESVT